MTTTYRACYYLTADLQGETVLTGPEHAHLSDDALRAEAAAEAERAGIIGDAPGITTGELRDGLRIGDWTA